MPSPLVTIVVLTVLVVVMGWDVRTVGDMGAMPDTLPVFLIPQIPLTLETLLIIFPYSAAVAVVGLLESLMTQNIVDDLTDTRSSRNQECIGQGIANTATGFIGGMAGCAMIGQSIINVKSGGRGRLSAFTAGVVLLILVVGLGRSGGADSDAGAGRHHDHGVDRHVLVVLDQGAAGASALVLDRHDRDRRHGRLHPQPRHRRSGRRAAVGHLLCRQDRATVPHPLDTVTPDGRERTYVIEGQLFYGSAEDFADAFDFREALDRVIIDVSRAHIWDISSVQALDMAILKFRREGAEVEVDRA